MKSRPPVLHLSLAVLLVLLGSSAWNYWVGGGKELTIPLITTAWYAAAIVTFPQLTQSGPIPGMIAGFLTLITLVLVLSGLAILGHLQTGDDYSVAVLIGAGFALTGGWPLILVSGGIGWLAQRVFIRALPSNNTVERDAL